MKAYHVQLSTGSYDMHTDYDIGYYFDEKKAEAIKALLERVLTKLPKPAETWAERTDEYYEQIESVKRDIMSTFNVDAYYLDADCSTWLFHIDIQ